ncbi:hypothetical protein EVAR_26048_1 [Eumeta japonica]|uniref:Uncharacterized protein n=1 Tax=Eumeta variegata TaxID=151549 RepID=A0A4C1VRH0_EUMVA|nr:hypothetical protein EVAR_26048_1 [Eumeta japonica]
MQDRHVRYREINASLGISMKSIDESFTKVDCDNFFKTILKNAHKRSESNQRMSAPKVRVVKKKATAKTHPIDMPIENVNGEGSGQNNVEAPDQNNEERSDQNSVEILYQNNKERPDKKAKGFPGNCVRS